MRFRVPILLCALLLVGALVLGATPVVGQPQADGTHFEAQLHPDGDAEWSVTLRIPIADDRDREEFEAFASRFEAGQTEHDLGEDAFERAVEEASAASGREMALDSVRRESEIISENDGGETVEYGVLRLAFTWESFARTGENGTLYVDDAFNTTDGTWLPGLSTDQSLTVRAPRGYGGPTTSPIGADGGDLRWDGPATFEPGYFTIVYHPSSTGPQTGDMSNTLVVGALGLSGVALLLGLYLLVARQRRRDKPHASEAPAQATGAESAASETASTATGENDERTGAEEPHSPADGEPDFELLSDEERVEYLLEQNGGRMKQATIVKETGWSNAKVSQLLSAMDDADQVDKLRIGRENLISLPGEGLGDIDDGADADRDV